MNRTKAKLEKTKVVEEKKKELEHIVESTANPDSTVIKREFERSQLLYQVYKKLCLKEIYHYYGRLGSKKIGQSHEYSSKWDSILINNDTVRSKIYTELRDILRSKKSNQKHIPTAQWDSILNKNDSIRNQKFYDLLKLYRTDRISLDTYDFVNKQFPYGPEALVNHIFPEDGFSIYKHPDSIQEPHFKELFDIWSFYMNEMSNRFQDGAGRVFVLPIITEVEKVYLHSSFSFEDRIEDFASLNETKTWGDNCADYRFPNIGKYQSYYISWYGKQNYSEIEPFPDNMYYNLRNHEDGSYGMLVLYDSLSYKAKFIPVFAFIGAYRTLVFRFFYITKDKRIFIYEGATEQTVTKRHTSTENLVDIKYDVDLKKRFEIAVLDNGEIKITDQNKDN
ncbi:MAG: hypothetical protein K9H64_16270 [Bacteroidales bacterium]|nr:hypothetical protein [Bacteroidales bacterium]MCF8457525.1 hypothetical protein [Bacteroidales bacterium]